MVLCCWTGRAHAAGPQKPLHCPAPAPGPRVGEQKGTAQEEVRVVPGLFFGFGQPALLQCGLIVELDFALCRECSRSERTLQTGDNKCYTVILRFSGEEVIHWLE